MYELKKNRELELETMVERLNPTEIRSFLRWVANGAAEAASRAEDIAASVAPCWAAEASAARAATMSAWVNQAAAHKAAVPEIAHWAIKWAAAAEAAVASTGVLAANARAARTRADSARTEASRAADAARAAAFDSMISFVAGIGSAHSSAGGIVSGM